MKTLPHSFKVALIVLACSATYPASSVSYSLETDALSTGIQIILYPGGANEWVSGGTVNEFNHTISDSVGAVGANATLKFSAGPTGFTASGEAFASGWENLDWIGDAYAESVFSYTFTLEKCYYYEFAATTLGDHTRVGRGGAYVQLVGAGFTRGTGTLSPGEYTAMISASALGYADTDYGRTGYGVGEFSATLSLEPCNIPDGGTTSALLLMGCFALSFLRRTLRRSDALISP